MGKSSIYTKVKGRHAGSLQISELFKGPDHFLYVRSVFRLTELYRRIPFNQITGLQIIQTANRALLNVAMLILLAIFGVLWYSMGKEFDYAAFWIILCALPLFFMLINTLAGSCCRVYLFTRHRRHRLQNFQRTRHAIRFQKDLLDMLALQQESSESSLDDDPVSLQMATPRLPPPRLASPTQILKLSSVILLVAAAVDFFWIIWIEPQWLFLKGVLLALGVVTVIWGAIRQRRLGENSPASLWFISCLVFYLVNVGVIYLLCIPIYITSSVQSETSWQTLVRLIEKAQTLPMPFYVLMIVTMFVQLALGILGFFSYRAGREQV